jgi:hypothetical protein
VHEAKTAVSLADGSQRGERRFDIAIENSLTAFEEARGVERSKIAKETA